MWISVCLLLLSPVAGNSGTQIPASASAREGRPVKLSCQHSTTYTYDALGWYQQLPGQQSLLLLHRNERGNEYTRGSVAPRFSSELSTHVKSFTLSIDGAQRADSAVYFCALWDPPGYGAPRAPDTNCRSGGRSRKRRGMSHFPCVHRGEGEGSQVSEGTKKCVIVYKQGGCTLPTLWRLSVLLTPGSPASLPALHKLPVCLPSTPTFFSGTPLALPRWSRPIITSSHTKVPHICPMPEAGCPSIPTIPPQCRIH
ncbi:unnamed protein product [Lepidochelys olivacea]